MFSKNTFSKNLQNRFFGQLYHAFTGRRTCDNLGYRRYRYLSCIGPNENIYMCPLPLYSLRQMHNITTQHDYSLLHDIISSKKCQISFNAEYFLSQGII